MFPSFSNLAERKKRLAALQAQVERDNQIDEIKRQAYENAIFAVDNNARIANLLPSKFSLAAPVAAPIGIPTLGPSTVTKTESDLVLRTQLSKIAPESQTKPGLSTTMTTTNKPASTPAPPAVGARGTLGISDSSTPASSTPNFHFIPELPPSPAKGEQQTQTRIEKIRREIRGLFHDHPVLSQQPFHPFNISKNEFDEDLVIYSDGLSDPKLYRYNRNTNKVGDVVKKPHKHYDWEEALRNMYDAINAHEEYGEHAMAVPAPGKKALQHSIPAGDSTRRNLSGTFDEERDVKDEPMLGVEDDSTGDRRSRVSLTGKGLRGVHHLSNKTPSGGQGLRLNKLVGRGFRGAGRVDVRNEMNRDHLQKQLGTKFVVLKSLREGFLTLRYPSGNQVARKLAISQAVADIVDDALERKFNPSKYDQLSNDDKKIIYDLFKITRYDQTIRKALANPYEIEDSQKHMIEHDKLRGQLMLGNRNERNISEFCKLTTHLYKLGLISQKQLQENVQLLSYEN
jgi:hypothetical protein